MPQSLTFKIIVIGNCGIGKTCMVSHYTQSAPVAWTYVPTKEKNITEHNMKIQNFNVCLQVWDLSGDDVYRTLTAACYFNAHAAIIGYSLCDQGSFYNVRHWMENIEMQLSTSVFEDLPKAIVGLKQDSKKCCVDVTNATEVAASYGCKHYTGSCKINRSFDQVFADLTLQLLDRRKEQIPISINKPTNREERLPSKESLKRTPNQSYSAVQSRGCEATNEQAPLLKNERKSLEKKPANICDCGCTLM